MTTRDPNLELPPDSASIIAEVNFTTTRAGLTGQVHEATPINYVFMLFKISKYAYCSTSENMAVRTKICWNVLWYYY